MSNTLSFVVPESDLELFLKLPSHVQWKVSIWLDVLRGVHRDQKIRFWSIAQSCSTAALVLGNRHGYSSETIARNYRWYRKRPDWRIFADPRHLKKAKVNQ